MPSQNYSLEVISLREKSKNKAFKKYRVEGIDTIGVLDAEVFEVKFKNHTAQKVQVKLSIDGTDILSGEQATTEPTKDMWVVDGLGTLSLKAWPEQREGGAAFVFTNANNSVALHTHGDLSSRGIIAAAVYTEGHVEPLKINIEQHHHHYNPIYPYFNPYYPYLYYPYLGGPCYSGCIISCGCDGSCMHSLTGNNNITLDNFSISQSNTVGNVNSSTYLCANNSATINTDLNNLVAVGAGDYTEQEITYTQGLIKPLLTETIRIRYLKWKDLKKKLGTNTDASPHASGFPGDKPLISLGNTPRLKTNIKIAKNQEELFTRF